jgi:hypothetical protein
MIPNRSEMLCRRVSKRANWSEVKTLRQRIVRPFGVERLEKRLAQPHSRQDTRRQAVAAVRLKLKLLVPEQRFEVERAVEMRKDRAATGWLPLQTLAEAFAVYSQQDEVFLPGKVLGKCAFQLIGSREVDKAVAEIVGRAFEAASGLCLGKGGAARDLVDRPIHGSFYLAPIGEAEQAGAEMVKGDWTRGTEISHFGLRSRFP